MGFNSGFKGLTSSVKFWSPFIARTFKSSSTEFIDTMCRLAYSYVTYNLGCGWNLSLGVIQGNIPSTATLSFVSGALFVFLYAQYDAIRLNISCGSLLTLTGWGEGGGKKSERNGSKIA